MFDPNKKINPFEKLADHHSDALRFINNQLSKIDKDKISIEQVISSISDYFIEITGEKSKAMDSIYYAALCEIQNKRDESITEVLKKAEISNKAIEYIESIRKLDSNDPNTLLSEIEKIEQAVLNSNLGLRDARHILFYSAIAKGSVKYWSEEQKSKKSFWKRFFGSIKKLPWRADADEGLKEAAKTGIESLLLPVAPHITIGVIMVKVIGGAVIGSISEYIHEAESNKQKNTAEEHRKNLKGPKPKFRDQE